MPLRLPEPSLPCESTFSVEMTVTRIHEDPRVTKPYTEQQWQAIERLGHQIDAELEAGAVRLTMGGEPTFVSIDDMDGLEWNTTAVGPTKRILAAELLRRLHKRFASAGLLHYGQSKWYPGEPLPRWALACYWRRDGEPIWQNHKLIADESISYGYGAAEAEFFIHALARRLGVGSEWAIPAYEDVWHYLWTERRLPVNVDPFDSKLENETDRARLARVFEQGLDRIVGYALPLKPVEHGPQTRWVSGPWFFRQEHMFLVPGDSPMGFRLPLDSIPWSAPADRTILGIARSRARRCRAVAEVFRVEPSAFDRGRADSGSARVGNNPQASRDDGSRRNTRRPSWVTDAATWDDSLAETLGENPGDNLGGGNGNGVAGSNGHAAKDPLHAGNGSSDETPSSTTIPPRGRSAHDIVRTAICIEPREGRLHVFMPPTVKLEDYLDLVAAIEETAAETSLPVIIEGYTPPHDYRLNNLKVTPDPGVIEVNIQPAHNWDELVKNTTGLYEDARQSRLGTEKFMLDGRHTGTGGGNHIVMGGATPVDSPFLRRPDLLRSLVLYWNNHPALSYLFSGTFIGPTSQAPRIDEARHDSLNELEIACRQLPERAANGSSPPWLVDRLFRNILTDLSGNTHRAEFCIDKLFSPDTSTGRLGLLEFRAFEMPPHARMSLTQQLLLRALIAQFWKRPYPQRIVRWGSKLHDRFLLPPPLCRRQDFADVVAELAKGWISDSRGMVRSALGIQVPRVWNRRVFGFDIGVASRDRAVECVGRRAGRREHGSLCRFVGRAIASKSAEHDRPPIRRHVQRPPRAAASDGHCRRVCRRRAISGLAAAELFASDDSGACRLAGVRYRRHLEFEIYRRLHLARAHIRADETSNIFPCKRQRGGKPPRRAVLSTRPFAGRDHSSPGRLQLRVPVEARPPPHQIDRGTSKAE